MTSDMLKKLVKKALKNLSGDWVIIGGTVLPLVHSAYRSTVDIDMVPVHDTGGNDSLMELMDLADSLGLPVEALNSAGLFFLKKIPDWKNRLVIHAESKNCRILRPNFDLFLELKVARLSESDVTDIEAYLTWHQDHRIEVDFKKVRTILKGMAAKLHDPEKKQLLARILSKFDSP